MPACVAEQTQWDDVDLHFMARAIRLANGAQGTTAPNPPVGCVIVRENVVIAEGATGPGGRPHAEANALSCINHEANGATAYVTLEPCCHHGETPPCSNALVASGVNRVVIAVATDPDPRVSGRGVSELRQAGVRVDCGCLEQEALDTLAGFFHLTRTGRPLAVMANAGGLDCDDARQMAETIRTCDATLVVKTARDDEQLALNWINTTLRMIGQDRLVRVLSAAPHDLISMMDGELDACGRLGLTRVLVVSSKSHAGELVLSARVMPVAEQVHGSKARGSFPYVDRHGTLCPNVCTHPQRPW